MRSILLFTFFVLQSLTISAQYEWEQKTSLPSDERERVFSFMIDDVIYIGGGRIGSTNTDEFWAYDINTDTWEQKADSPGGAVRNAVGFSIGEHGYAGFGYTGSVNHENFWRYDPLDDSWSQISSPPIPAVSFANGLSNDEYGFICFGGDGDANTFSNKIWRYDPVSDTWNLFATLPAEGRWAAVAHIIDNKMYVGGGGKISSSYSDFWLYNMDTGTWSQLADIPTSSTIGCVSFVFDSKIVLVNGIWSLNIPGIPLIQPSAYAYNISFFNWQLAPDFPETARIFGFSHSHESGGFVGLGSNSVLGNKLQDIYRFSNISTAIIQPYEDDTTIFPNPTADKVTLNTPYTLSHLEIYNKQGALLMSKYQKNGHQEADLSAFPTGTYFLVLGDKNKQQVISKKVVKH